ncbi:helix-turn-helix transcriptional regulator [Halobaculum roseum]|uniref:Helix-turn-helix transcriptional regulator n=1 Tax=Halobaculum roseum TaxID=2175149 RepID=A0ABD5MSU1_9EURY|nr:hypothetical protein [Halobaculum roseum]
MRYVALLAALALIVSLAAGATAAGAVQSANSPSPADLPVGGADTGQAIASSPGAASPQLASTVGAPRTNFTVSLREDRSARWTVETRVRLDDEHARDAFREYASEYEAGDAEGGPTVEPFENAAAAAAEATGREMSIERVNRTATLTNRSGVLRLRFTWTNFLEPGDDGVLALGDAFRTPSNGTWFGSLSASQRLVIEPPADYEVSDVSQGFSYSISDRRIVAEGPQRFEAGDISVRYEPGDPEPESSFLLELLAGAGVVLLFVVAVLAYRRGNVAGAGAGGSADANADAGTGSTPGGARGSTEGAAADPGPNDGNGRDGGSAGAAPDRAETGEGSTGGAVGATAAGDGTTADGTDGDGTAAAGEERDDGATEPEEDLELLSDEERVERLLDGHGGRMRQGTIVDETGWSDAKVSQLLSAMADEGRVEKLRLGRENLISLVDDGDDDGGDDDGSEGDGSGGNGSRDDGDGGGGSGDDGGDAVGPGPGGWS